ncbi:hypothetical protein Pla86_05140 [Planctomycetes bacterium Pla86]|uniref:Uncharacterized protein n=1 Tax=Engelhardtia mirabilis TaxID=2528011 RepID=A0A518BEM8_9BACT|nr:hypothetical protein Pla133_05140 [Planctomycetes bacterium Pla133]QDU99775.1 hypothetical protein Pla86_05140 [Planctomycetes bacterium Pla86]
MRGSTGAISFTRADASDHIAIDVGSSPVNATLTIRARGHVPHECSLVEVRGNAARGEAVNLSPDLWLSVRPRALCDQILGVEPDVRLTGSDRETALQATSSGVVDGALEVVLSVAQLRSIGLDELEVGFVLRGIGSFVYPTELSSGHRQVVDLEQIAGPLGLPKGSIRVLLATEGGKQIESSVAGWRVEARLAEGLAYEPGAGQLQSLQVLPASRVGRGFEFQNLIAGMRYLITACREGEGRVGYCHAIAAEDGAPCRLVTNLGAEVSLEFDLGEDQLSEAQSVSIEWSLSARGDEGGHLGGGAESMVLARSGGAKIEVAPDLTPLVVERLERLGTGATLGLTISLDGREVERRELDVDLLAVESFTVVDPIVIERLDEGLVVRNWIPLVERAPSRALLCGAFVEGPYGTSPARIAARVELVEDAGELRVRPEVGERRGDGDATYSTMKSNVEISASALLRSPVLLVMIDEAGEPLELAGLMPDSSGSWASARRQQYDVELSTSPEFSGVYRVNLTWHGIRYSIARVVASEVPSTLTVVAPSGSTLDLTPAGPRQAGGQERPVTSVSLVGSQSIAVRIR